MKSNEIQSNPSVSPSVALRSPIPLARPVLDRRRRLSPSAASRDRPRTLERTDALCRWSFREVDDVGTRRLAFL